MFTPAASVRGPKHVGKGKTPVLKTEEARTLLDSIELQRGRTGKRFPHQGPARPGPHRRDGLQLRPRQGRRSAMKVEDYYTRAGEGGSGCTRKEGRSTRCPPTTTPKLTLDAYLEAAGIAKEKRAPVPFHPRQNRRAHEPTMTATTLFRMVKRRAQGRRRLSSDRLQPHLPSDRNHGLPRSTRAPSRRPSRSPPTSRQRQPSSTTGPRTQIAR